MKVEVLNGLGEVTLLDATRVLICTDDGTPAAVASEWMAGAIQVGYAGDRSTDFPALLAALGVDRTVVVTAVAAKPFDEIRV